LHVHCHRQLVVVFDGWLSQSRDALDTIPVVAFFGGIAEFGGIVVVELSEFGQFG
jgi:hypothetical protein